MLIRELELIEAWRPQRRVVTSLFVAETGGKRRDFAVSRQQRLNATDRRPRDLASEEDVHLPLPDVVTIRLDARAQASKQDILDLRHRLILRRAGNRKLQHKLLHAVNPRQ